MLRSVLRSRPWQGVVSVAELVSTRPVPASYIWGGRRSILATITFYGLFAVRLFSPLQWLKFAVRTSSKRRPTTNLRPDFPASYTELYFLFVLALALATYLVTRHHPPHGAASTAISVVGWISAVESLAWILYYLLFRGFIEGNYTIFNPAEYLLTFPVVAVGQAFVFALVTHHPVHEVLAALTGNPDVGSVPQLLVCALGLGYAGVAISVLLTSHPGIKTRPPQTVAILGSGDVVQRRIVPALHSLGYRRADITVIALADADVPVALHDAARIVQVPEHAVIDTALRSRAPTIIASPTHAHLPQLLALATAGVRFAVEKPIATARSERDLLRQNPALMQNGFALSYYSLEKALALTYFLQPRPAFEPYLSMPGGLDRPLLHQLRDRLGVLERVEVTLIEGSARSPMLDDRLWTEVPDSLRTFSETTIHPLLVVRHAVGATPIRWDAAALGRYEPRAAEIRARHHVEIAPTYAWCSGRAGDVAVDVVTAKHAAPQQARRGATLTYAGGSIVCDFDARSATVTAGPESTTIATEPVPNYGVLMSLFAKFALEGWGATRTDDFLWQLDALDAWDDLCDLVDRHAVAVQPYDASLPTGPQTALAALSLPA